MTQWLICYSCNMGVPLVAKEDQTKCSSCGSNKVEILSKEKFDEMFKAGSLYDPIKRAKKKRK